MRIARLTLSVVMLLSLVAAVGAQAPVTSADLTKLEATADDIAKKAEGLRASDPTLSTEITKRLSDLRDDITYQKVKMRRGETVSRDEYTLLRDKLERLRITAQPEKVMAQPVLDPIAVVVPVGTEMDVRLQTPLNSGTAKIEQRFEATTILDLKIGDKLPIPAGTVARGFVSSVSPAGRLDRRGNLTLSFDEILLGKSPTRFRASVEQAIDGKMGQDITRIGAGATIGAIVGGIIGGGKGALVGVLVGSGGTMAATEGADVSLPVGTILRIRVDQPLTVQIGG
ncbi:MAG TPA: hypothetical protein VJN96_04590 [Vicinamibacterales bacterium]|nr:hypothetical protein [Vicinamibacterales bacterium]